MLASHVHPGFCREKLVQSLLLSFLQFAIYFKIYVKHLSFLCLLCKSGLWTTPDVFSPIHFFADSLSCSGLLQPEPWMAGSFCSVDWTIKPRFIFGCPVANTYSFSYPITQNTNRCSLYVCFCFCPVVLVSFELLWRNVDMDKKKKKNI